MENSNSDKKFTLNSFLIPGAIIIAGIIIAGALYLSPSKLSTTGQADLNNQPTDEKFVVGDIRQVTDSDHILGNISAPVKIVEYSDLECPFCASFHPTLKKTVEEFKGEVAWVYRHFPLDSIHTKARREAEASECAAELGGNDAFWRYVDRLFTVTPSNDGLAENQLFEIASYSGLDAKEFKSCLESGKYSEKIEKDLQDATVSGGRGTPHTIVIAPNGKKFPIQGAQPYDVVRATIETALKEK